jgi:[ribosomal protein S5]-alanine N-acetyltransferase
MRLTTPSCVIRQWEPTDKASLVRHADNRSVWRNLRDRFPHPYTSAAADYWLTRCATMAPCTHWAIEVEGEAVGSIGFDVGEDVQARSGEFGYWLGERYWGRGIMSAAVDAVVSRVFADCDIERLQASVFEWNPASMRVLEKCGFEREGILRKSVFKDGRLIDAVLYARVR